MGAGSAPWLCKTAPVGGHTQMSGGNAVRFRVCVGPHSPAFAALHRALAALPAAERAVAVLRWAAAGKDREGQTASSGSWADAPARAPSAPAGPRPALPAASLTSPPPPPGDLAAALRELGQSTARIAAAVERLAGTEGGPRPMAGGRDACGVTPGVQPTPEAAPPPTVHDDRAAKLDGAWG